MCHDSSFAEPRPAASSYHFKLCLRSLTGNGQRIVFFAIVPFSSNSADYSVAAYWQRLWRLTL